MKYICLDTIQPVGRFQRRVSNRADDNRSAHGFGERPARPSLEVACDAAICLWWNGKPETPETGDPHGETLPAKASERRKVSRVSLVLAHDSTAARTNTGAETRL